MFECRIKGAIVMSSESYHIDPDVYHRVKLAVIGATISCGVEPDEVAIYKKLIGKNVDAVCTITFNPKNDKVKFVLDKLDLAKN